uniref:Uncharacterized protein n=1 Tax=Arundo donax TaxID=35708 RepID=A0A0A8Y6J0_ARUDO
MHYAVVLFSIMYKCGPFLYTYNVFCFSSKTNDVLCACQPTIPVEIVRYERNCYLLILATDSLLLCAGARSLTRHR